MSKKSPSGNQRQVSVSPDPLDFNLAEFFPYLVRIYYRAVSDAVANIYSSEFGLTVSEWRTMAVLGPVGAMSATNIVEQSSMDKVNVSRAIKGLQERGYLKRDVDGKDRRRAVLRLTAKGRKVFATLVPMLKQLEIKCLQGLSAEESRMLINLMERVRVNAEVQPRLAD